MRGDPKILTTAKHLLVYLKQALVAGNRHGYMRWASPQPGLGIHHYQVVADIGVQSWCIAARGMQAEKPTTKPTEIFLSYDVADVAKAPPRF